MDSYNYVATSAEHTTMGWDIKADTVADAMAEAARMMRIANNRQRHIKHTNPVTVEIWRRSEMVAVDTFNPDEGLFA